MLKTQERTKKYYWVYRKKMLKFWNPTRDFDFSCGALPFFFLASEALSKVNLWVLPLQLGLPPATAGAGERWSCTFCILALLCWSLP